MHPIFKRSFSILLALVLCLSLLATVRLPQANAADTVTYRYGSTSEYSNCSNVIYNWGTRGTTATFLSPNAVKFYQDNNTSYEALSKFSGSSTVSSVPNSTLFQKLRTLMTSNHSYETSYNATRDMFAFTDCQNSALTSTKISSFYSGSAIGPGWDSGSTWNREHTWPNSKGDTNGNGENDIMMLRPASSSENSGRNNTAYGEGTSYYNPNKASGGTYDLRGDVARIVLYVYVRWQDTTSEQAVLFGTDGVIESKEVLLKWLEEDPVDTWEMGRNDSVESITGTRNVFVDYPELGFRLFGAAVPSDYTSPSNNSGSTETDTVTIRFLENGEQTKSYSVSAGQSIEFPEPTSTPETGYSFAGWVSTTVNRTDAKPAAVYLPGNTATAAEQTYYALYTNVDLSVGSGNVYKLYSGEITAGDYIITYTDSTGTGAMKAEIISNRLAYQTVLPQNNLIVNPDSAIVWTIAPSGEHYTLYGSEGYATASYTNNQMVFLNYQTDYVKWSVSGTKTYDFVNLGNSKYLRKNSTHGFSAYSSSTGGPLTLYKATTGTVFYSTSTTVCAHTNTQLSGVIAATCTTAGYTGNTVCADCGITLKTGSAIAATGHSYVNDICSGCGAAKPGTNGNAGDYVLITPETATAGKYIIGAVRSGTYPTIYPATSAISGDWSVSSTTVSASNDIITSASLPADAQVVTLTGDNTNGFTVGFEVNGTMQYLGYTSTTASRKLALGTQYSTTLWKIVTDSDGNVALASSYGEKSYTISQNSTGSAPIRGYYTGTIYTGIYLFRQVDAAPQAPKVAQVGDVQYESFADAYAAANDQPIKLLANLGSNTDYYALALTKDVTIDLNGYFGYLSATGGHTVYGMDTMTTDYDTEEYGTLYITGAAVAAADGYLALEEDTNAHSFHAYEFSITHIRLQPYADALGFKAQLKGDYRILAASAYGFHMGAQLNVTKSADGAPTDGSFTLRLKNIMAAGGGEIPVTASAFVVIEGQTLTTQVQTTSMKDAVTAVNNIWSSLSTGQQDAVKALYNQHSATMAAWLGDDNNIA